MLQTIAEDGLSNWVAPGWQPANARHELVSVRGGPAVHTAAAARSGCPVSVCFGTRRISRTEVRIWLLYSPYFLASMSLFIYG